MIRRHKMLYMYIIIDRICVSLCDIVCYMLVRTMYTGSQELRLPIVKTKSILILWFSYSGTRWQLLAFIEH